MCFGILRLRHKVLITFTIVAVITMILVYKLKYQDIQINALHSRCEVIHVGLICSGSDYNVIDLQTMLKSIYFFRNNPLHFHIVVDETSENVLKTLFHTWDVPQVNATFYYIHNTTPVKAWHKTIPNISESYHLLKLTFPQILSSVVADKIIVIDFDLFFAGDILQLWNVFDNFSIKHTIGMIKDQTSSYLRNDILPGRPLRKEIVRIIMLYDLKRLATPSVKDKKFHQFFEETSLLHEDTIYDILEQSSDVVYSTSCKWNAQSNYVCRIDEKVLQNSLINQQNDDDNYYKDYYAAQYNMFLNYNSSFVHRELDACNTILHYNTTEPSLDDECSDFRELQSHKWRTLLYFRQFKHTSTEEDVTLVSQLTYDRFKNVEELSNHWNGPMSLALYLTDSEFQECLNLIENSRVLQKRLDIAYHAVFKDGKYYPINHLRNIAMRNVNTPYVFLTDIDFIPMNDSYLVLKKYISEMADMQRIALVVPAFETNATFPSTKNELLNMLNKTLFQFHFKYFKTGHAPVNYIKWSTAEKPYKVNNNARNIRSKDENVPGFAIALIRLIRFSMKIRLDTQISVTLLTDFYEGAERILILDCVKSPEAVWSNHVKWKKNFEPYIVVHRNVTEYDRRFFGFGWDKVSHIRELQAQGYAFIVLPNVFIVHKDHPRSTDRVAFLRVKRYRECLIQRQKEFVLYLRLKYLPDPSVTHS